MQQFNKNANFSFRTVHSGPAIRNLAVFLLVYLMKPVQWQMELKHCRMNPDHLAPCITSIELYSIFLEKSSDTAVTLLWPESGTMYI